MLNLEALFCSSLGLVIYVIAIVSYEVRDKLTVPLIDEDEHKYHQTNHAVHDELNKMKETIASIHYIIKNSAEFALILVEPDESLFLNFKT